MADTNRDPAAALRGREGVAALLRKPLAHDVFAALRELQADPAVPAIGASLRPGGEPYRFRQDVSLGFAATSIARAEWNERARRVELWLRFTGLLGPNGPMPIHLTEFILDRQRHHADPTLAAFLNVFHHRIYSLFFRAWALNQPAVDHDREDERRHAFYYRCLVGLGTVPEGARDSVPELARLFYSGWLGGLSRSPDGLAAILTDFLGVPTSVQNFQGSWLELPRDSRCRLGGSPSTGTLGSTAFAGDRIWLTHLKFRLRFGPLSWEEYQRLLPGGDAFRQVRDWIRFYVGEEFTWEAQLVLKRSEFVPSRLGGVGQLGWTTWMGTPREGRDLADLVLQPPA